MISIYQKQNKTKKLQHNVFQFILPFFSTTYFVLYLVWYVYDNTYNLIVDYSQFIITFFSLVFQELIFKIWDWFSGELKLAPPSKSIHIWIFFSFCCFYIIQLIPLCQVYHIPTPFFWQRKLKDWIGEILIYWGGFSLILQKGVCTRTTIM